MAPEHPVEVERHHRAGEFHVMSISSHQRARAEDARTAPIAQPAQNLLEFARGERVRDQNVDVADLSRRKLTVILMSKMHSFQKDHFASVASKSRFELAYPCEKQGVPSILSQKRFAQRFENGSREQRRERMTLRGMKHRSGDRLRLRIIKKRAPVEIRRAGDRFGGVALAASDRANQPKRFAVRAANH